MKKLIFFNSHYYILDFTAPKFGWVYAGGSKGRMREIFDSSTVEAKIARRVFGDGDWVKITHSSHSLEGVVYIPEGNFYEAIYGVNPEKVANEQWGNVNRTGVLGYIEGWKACLKLLQANGYNKQHMVSAFCDGVSVGVDYGQMEHNDSATAFYTKKLEEFKATLNFLEEWDVEVVGNCKIKILCTK